MLLAKQKTNYIVHLTMINITQSELDDKKDIYFFYKSIQLFELSSHSQAVILT